MFENLAIINCTECEESFYTEGTKKKIKIAVAIHKARERARITTMDQVITSEELARQLSVSKQRISAMMRNGQINFVMNDCGLKLPLKSEIQRLQNDRKLSKT